LYHDLERLSIKVSTNNKHTCNGYLFVTHVTDTYSRDPMYL